MNMADKLYPIMEVREEIKESEMVLPCWIVHSKENMNKSEMVTYAKMEIEEELQAYGFSSDAILIIQEDDFLPEFCFLLHRSERNPHYEFLAFLSMGDTAERFFLKEWYSLSYFLREIEPIRKAFFLQAMKEQGIAALEE